MAKTLSTENEKAIVRQRIGHALMIAFLAVLLVVFIWPFFLVLTNAFKNMSDITGEPLSLIGSHGFTIENFTKAMRKMHFWRVFGNSAIITTFSTILTILFSAMAAYVIVRNPKWTASKLTFSAMVASMVIPFQVIMVPLVAVYGGTLGLLNSRTTLIFMHVGFSVSLAVFMFHGAIKTNVPVELEWRTFWTIVFPLLKPTAATVAIIDAMAFWNDYLLPSLVLTDKKIYTIPIATQVFYGTYSTDIGLVMAALLLAMLPILVMYLLLQRFIVAGVTAGAVKG